MITIRLTRVGKTNDPSFRVIVVDSKKKVKTGSYLEMVGSYDPRVDRIELNAERIKHWLSMGAKASDTVHNLLVSKKIIDAKKINVLPAYKAPEKAAETPAQAEAPAKAPAAEATEEPKVEVAPEKVAE
ncbi:MAG: 30S ribosomal protein S16 [Patescibacteria group bacterium]|nr:30S ribosomal protein S16 [Patescibacteria group bacterium]